MILVIGSKEEFHSKHIHDLIKSKKEDVCYFDTRTIQESTFVSWFPSDKNINGHLTIDNKKIKLEDIKSVYWRWHYGYSVAPKDNSSDSLFVAQMIEREIISTVESLFASLDFLWINSLNSIEMHKKKAYQLHLMAQNGIRVPRTLITSNENDLRSFFETNNRQIIYKPVRGGAHTKKIKESDFTKERLKSLKISPVQLQEFIDGVDIRIYVIGDEVFAAEIQAETIDFRNDPNAKLVPVDLPEKVKQDCFKIMNLLDLNFSGIDVRRSKTGEYVFIEANPSPMFTYFEEKTGFPISENLVERLILGKID